MTVIERGYQYRDIPELPGGSRWGLPLTPPDPDKLTGPEVGTLVAYRDKYGLGPNKVENSLIVVRVKERYYHWSPEVVLFKDGTPIGRGYIMYDSTVIEFRPNGDSMVVNDSALSDIPVGAVIG